MDMAEYVKVCPSCGSDDVSIWMLGQGHVGSECRSCRFQAIQFPEMTSDAAKKFRDNLKYSK